MASFFTVNCYFCRRRKHLETMKSAIILSVLYFLTLTFTPAVSSAEVQQAPPLYKSNSLNEVWINAGFYSYHFDQSQDLNNNNLGLGVEYRYATASALTAGRYYNSDRQNSLYLAAMWEPFSLGPVRAGGFIGAVNGYPRANNGEWFPLILPSASIEYKNIGFNLTITPTYKNIIYGSLSLQIKFKIY